MLPQGVTLQTRGPSERSVAERTRKRLFTRVAPPVDVELAQEQESSRAVRALERARLARCAHVHFQCVMLHGGGQRKTSVALLARKRFDTPVQQPVSSQRAVAQESGVAIGAGKGGRFA